MTEEMLPASDRRPHRWPIVVLANVVGLLVIAGMGSATAWWFLLRDDTVTKTAAMTFTLVPGAAAWSASQGSCAGIGGYADIGPATEVRLSADGKLMDVAHLGIGDSSAGNGSCVYSFTLKAESGHKFYSIEPGRRGSVTYTWEQLDGAALTLGK